MRKINFLELVKFLNNNAQQWDIEYIDTFKDNQPENWKSLEYYFRMYVGNGEVKINAKKGSILIERTDT